MQSKKTKTQRVALAAYRARRTARMDELCQALQAVVNQYTDLRPRDRRLVFHWLREGLPGEPLDYGDDGYPVPAAISSPPLTSE